jgi:hypothetical protein
LCQFPYELQAHQKSDYNLLNFLCITITILVASNKPWGFLFKAFGLVSLMIYLAGFLVFLKQEAWLRN